MNRKTISIISYLTIVGWIISFVVYHNGGRSSFAQYHLKQSFGLGILGVIFGLIFIPIFPVDPIISTLFLILSAIILIVLIFGILNAVNQKRKPIPLIGLMFVDRFHFIKY
ncbi:hypothetical protein [Flavobacterium hibernum]|uniref:Import component protein n=1 Tax=Flavobacterium hibernum TaxID=37752 RepID=A0A0D0ERI9_9FLAO|nr:hypothetical protein [Flavobacterium hibernum]KIO50748.1 hypothetical protein IW18_21575 [Flavobacterium hibernum]OXA84354.1 hypothetical protein B0A73_20010 [Flavobacterium hibernum]STO18714.1 Uncharacterised protein [Flavobacterium hibernum]